MHFVRSSGGFFDFTGIAETNMQSRESHPCRLDSQIL
jgi:hypothetical protein